MTKTVLTVDDSKVLRMIVGRHLRPFGVNVIEAENGEIGLAMARRLQPNLILLDYNMPVLDGYHTLEQMKSDPVLRGIPVIMLTTEAGSDTVLKLIKLGLRDYIAKPFSREDLLKKVNLVLKLYDGATVPTELEVAAKPAAPAVSSPESGNPSNIAEQAVTKTPTPSASRYLAEMGDVTVLRFPGEQDPTVDAFTNALAREIPIEMERMFQDGSTKLVIQLSPLLMSNSLVAKRLNIMLSRLQRNAMRVNVVFYSERSQQAFQQLSQHPKCQMFTSLEEALNVWGS